MIKYVEVKAPAKINLGLDITGLREDGYHLIDTIFASVSLYDYIKLSPNKKIELKCNSPVIPTGSKNLAFKAAKILQEHYQINKGVLIEIEKNIPIGGGMGGGSSNAAAVLRALPILWDIKIDIQQIKEIALSLGADVWYCYNGGLQRGTGIGEVLCQVNYDFSYKIAILPQDVHCSTPVVFSQWDKIQNKIKVNIENIINNIKENNIKAINVSNINTLENAVVKLSDKIKLILTSLRSNGIKVHMTGSGSTLFVISENEHDLNHLKQVYKGNIIICNILPVLPKVKIYTI